MRGMPPLHLTKVAVGCAEVSALADRLATRAEGGETWLVTRYRPTRHAELIGGSLYWIIKHQLIARSEIIGFAETEEGRCRIRLDDRLIAIRPRTRRAHQGWRYLTGADAPADFGGGEEESDLLPPDLAGKLSALALL